MQQVLIGLFLFYDYYEENNGPIIGDKTYKKRIHNILTKRHGSKNTMNLIHATMDALVRMKDAVAIANKRGVTIGEVFN